MKKRHYPSFIEGYIDYLSNKPTPKEYARWAAIWAISAAVERRVCTYTMESELYPNIFVMLAGPPAAGKGLAIQPARALVSSLGDNRVSASTLTNAALIDQLRAASRTIIIPGQKAIDYHCLNVVSPEFQVLFPAYDAAMLATVTDIYDCHPYGSRRRGGKGEYDFDLERPCITVCGATTPEHFFTTFPESAFRTGFFSRMFIVWGAERPRGKMVSDRKASGARDKFKKLGEDLKIISEYVGEFSFEPIAEELADEFYWANDHHGADPVPTHPRLLYYAARRPTHLVKLMQISAIDRCVDPLNLVLTEFDYRRAFDWLIEMETLIPLLWQDHSQGGEAQMVEDVYHEIWIAYQKSKKPIPKARVVQLFAARTQMFKIETIIKMMISGGWVEPITDDKFGLSFKPRARKPGLDDSH